MRRYTSLALGAALLATGQTGFAAEDGKIFEWVNNSVGFRYGQQYTNPNNPNKFAKRTYSFTHADGYKYGSNFFNLDVFLSDSRDPRKGTDHGGSEVYAVYRHQLFASRVFDQPLGTGLIKDYAFTFGFDANRNNNLASAKKRAIVFGPTLKFNGAAVLDLSLMYYREKNHSGIPSAKHPDHTFDATYMVNLTWLKPFQLGAHDAKFQGFVNYVGEKGEDYFDKDTAPETLMRTSLMVAAMPGAKRKPNLWLGVGYEYWHNKFGVDGGRGSRTSTPTVNLEFTF
ncbi:nucleoside-binding protein [Pseudomonas taiwanensis]|uniref:nucleoside-binding protein n=1 Tax=Pseudomonas taiwanensis TaxID=470150 RepID=UPI0015BD461F|nr:nucleoside-binding protein [Pseudomonas taiwanensis]NWL75529.1 nucleoside-binding protein [Pseudomonas taiwanensis]